MKNNNKDDDDVSATGGKDPSPPKSSSIPDWRTKRLADIYKCLKYVAHTSRCRDQGCKISTCNKLKIIIQHARTCELTVPGGCRLCKQLICLCCYHAKDCKEPACRFLYCIPIKKKLKTQQSQEKQTGKTQDLKKRIIALEKRKILLNILQKKAKQSKSSTQISSAGQPCSKLHSPTSDPTSSSGPPIGAVLAVKEVQTAAARQATQAPKVKMMSDTPGHMLKARNVTSQENSADVQKQQSHPDVQLGRDNIPVQSSGGSNSEADSIYSTIEMLIKEVQAAAARQAAEAPRAKMMPDTPGHMLKAGNVASQENSADVQKQQSHQDSQLGMHNTPVQSSGGSNSEADSIDSMIEMLTKEVQAAQAPRAKMMPSTPGHMLKAGNVASQENSADVQKQQSHQDSQLGTHNTPVQSSGNSNSEADSIDSTVEMLIKAACAAVVRQAAQVPKAKMMPDTPGLMLKTGNVTSQENSANVQNQQSHQDTQLGMRNTPVQSSGGSNSEPDSIDSITEMLTKVL